MLVFLALTFQGQQLGGPPRDTVGRVPAPAGVPDSAETRARLVRAEQVFLARWRAAWKGPPRRPPTFAERQARPRPDRQEIYRAGGASLAHTLDRRRVRSLYVRCYWAKPSPGTVDALPGFIRSAASARGACPSWILDEAERLPDASVVLDSALDSARRARVAAARDTLLALLDSAARALPGDTWLAGQRVRFHLDQAYRAPAHLDRALEAARHCGAEPWWCDALTAYVLHRRGEMAGADSAFQAASAVLPDSPRCAWLDVGALLDSAGREAYGRLSCAERESLAKRLWWLADPLWSEPGNARRAEHDARKVSLLLRAALPRDERFDWRPEAGGDAAAEMILRYGWPAHMHWGGGGLDSIVTGWLRARGSTPSPPYATAEYARGRLHAVPAWRALAEPARAARSDWTLTAPPGIRPVLRSTGLYMTVVRNYLTERGEPGGEWRRGISWWDSLPWWPAEHFARSRPLAQLPDGQTAVLRRDTGVVVAVAVDLPGADADAALAASRADTLAAALFVSPGPDVVGQVARGRAVLGGRVVLFGAAPARPAVVGLELRSARPNGPDLRTRFGLVPPPALRALRAGERAVSEPVLTTVPLDGSPLAEHPDSALARMRGSTTLRGVPRVGVYWESYGFGRDDTVEVSLRVERRDRPGVLERVAIALGAAEDRRGAAGLSWREPRPGRSGGEVAGVAPIRPHGLVLDVSALRPGEYSLEVSVGRPGEPPAKNRRGFSVR